MDGWDWVFVFGGRVCLSLCLRVGDIFMITYPAAYPAFLLLLAGWFGVLLGARGVCLSAVGLV